MSYSKVHSSELLDITYRLYSNTRPSLQTAVTQRLLEHSTPQRTNDVYTNIDPVLRQAISQLPVSEWV